MPFDDIKPYTAFFAGHREKMASLLVHGNEFRIAFMQLEYVENGGLLGQSDFRLGQWPHLPNGDQARLLLGE
jgi:hypothetical protein